MKNNLHIETVVVGQMATNCYVLQDMESNEAIVVDPGDDAEHISDVISRLHGTPMMIVATHGHFDHIMGAYALQLMYNIPFLLHEGDTFLLQTMQQSAMHYLRLPLVDPPPKISRFLKDKEIIAVGKQKLLVSHTPGHTPGSICLHLDHVVFVGDSIFANGAVGRTDFSYSQPLELANSVKMILRFPGSTRVLPGHGEPTTVEKERAFHII